MLLRIHLDGSWTAEEFSEFFYALQDLSYFWMSDMEYRFAPSEARNTSVARLRVANAKLRVVKINFSSPGLTDLAGFGAALSEIRQFIQFLVSHVSQRKDRELEREAKRLENLKTKLELMALLEDVNSDLPYSAKKLVETRSCEALIDAIADRRLTGSEVVDDPDE